MKVAFVSDTHFGYSRFSKDAKEQGTAAILDACKNADILLLGGDIFDEKTPSIETLTHVAVLLQHAKATLPKSDFPTILGIHGTHELSPKGSINPLAMMAKLGLMEDVHNKTVVIEENQTSQEQTGEPGRETKNNQAEKIAISGLGGIPDDLVKPALPKLSCKPQDGATNFFLLHQTLHEFVPQAKNLASIQDLPAGYDYYLCGHIHSKKELMGGKLLVSGSTILTQQKDEEQTPKGYFLIDTIARTHKFMEIPVRPFTVEELQFENATPLQVRIAIENKLAEILSKEWKKPPIIKLHLKGSMEKSAGNVDLSGFNSKDAYLTIDNQLEGSSLLDEIQKLKGARASSQTPYELGLTLLKENAKKANLDEKKATEYFEKFSEDSS